MSGQIELDLLLNNEGVSKSYVDNSVASAKNEAEQKVASEATIREQKDEEQKAYTDTKVSAEQSARQLADATLQQGITENAGGITANASAITNEAGTRESEDARIEGVINAHKTDADNRFDAMAETMAGGFDELGQTIATNLQAAKDYADSVAAGGLHWRGTVPTKAQLPGNANTGDFYTVTAEDNEEYAWNGSAWYGIGKSVDTTAINNRISANETAITTEKTARENAVSAEASARATADTSLNSKIAAEETRAKAAESANEAAITKEAEDRAGADTALEARVNEQLSQKTTAQIAADFDVVKSKLNSVADRIDNGGFWVFAVTDANGNVTFGQTINGELINALGQ